MNRLLRPLLAAMAATALYASGAPASAGGAAAASPSAIDLTGTSSPFLQGKSTMVPLRSVFQHLGAAVEWDARHKTARISRVSGGQTRTVSLQLGRKVALVNNRRVTLDQPAVMRNSTVYVPLRFVAEAMGAKVGWDDAQRRVLLGEPPTAYLRVPFHGQLSSTAAEQAIKSVSRRTVLALKSKITDNLAEVAHPTRGVRFSPYTFVDARRDRVYTRNQLRGIKADGAAYTWGNEAGSGAAIQMAPMAYWDRYVYDKDFANAPVIEYNANTIRGTTSNNLWKTYPNSVVVDYHYPPSGEGESATNDWKSLKLVYQKYRGQWYLVGVVHDEWTP